MTVEYDAVIPQNIARLSTAEIPGSTPAFSREQPFQYRLTHVFQHEGWDDDSQTTEVYTLRSWEDITPLADNLLRFTGDGRTISLHVDIIITPEEN